MQEGKAEFSLTFLSRPLVVTREELLRARLLRVAEDLLGRALLDDDAAVHEDDLIGHGAGKRHLVRDDDPV